MNEELAFKKALMLADRGDLNRARQTLDTLALQAASPVLRVRALVMLGELLLDTSPESARHTLTRAFEAASNIEDADDLLDVELHEAREILTRIT